jgi:hypothetical protein
VFDEIGEMHELERPPASQLVDFNAGEPLVKQPPEKREEGAEDSQEEHEGENSDGEEFINFFDRDEIESTIKWQQDNLFDELVQQRL